MRGPFFVAGAALCLCHLQRNGSILNLLCIRDRRGIVERVETECEGVKTEGVVHFSWQAQHFVSVTCKEMVRY